METPKYSFFFGHKPDSTGLNVFSQWYPAVFTDTHNGVSYTYANTEQYMMAQKALLFDDMPIFHSIMNTTDPAKIKNFGRLVKNFDQKKWNECKFEIVVNGNRCKFTQNPILMKQLLSTGDRIIVEASPYDKIWGIGLSASNAVSTPMNKWPGQNLLGKALMIVRDENID